MKIKASSILSFCVFVALSCLIFSCSKDKDSPSGKSHKVQFKVVTSPGCDIQLAVYGVGDDNTSETSLSGTEWASEILTAPAGTEGLYLSAQATGVDANSTIKAQIYVDGELKKEGSAKGEILVGNVSLEL
ncbi:MAG TPA: hypothetical protein VL053_14895 [Arachidicoccus sp.]|nr:hypothetical protein [Arachidicoccus sp.]